MPLTAGLVMAAAMRLALTSAHGLGPAAIVAATAATLLVTRLNPLVLLAVAAALGALGAV